MTKPIDRQRLLATEITDLLGDMILLVCRALIIDDDPHKREKCLRTRIARAMTASITDRSAKR
jgi:hypothetical protein